MATYSGILAWEIPWTEEPGGLPAMGSQRVRHDLMTEEQQEISNSLRIIMQDYKGSEKTFNLTFCFCREINQSLPVFEGGRVGQG